MMNDMIFAESGTAVQALNKLTGRVRRCIDDYNMMKDGETIAVGVSGGKDSLTLLYALANLRGFYPKRLGCIRG